MTTGLVYDERMLLHRCLWENHPERPERLQKILERCDELGLTERCIQIPSRLATKEEILLAHTTEHLERLRNICKNKDIETLENEASKFDSVFFNSLTYEVAMLTAGSVIELTKSVLKSNLQNGMAIVRPPGHHAMIDKFSGYCMINNVAVAAQAAINSKLAQRVLIVDFDVHHGQGTQEIFYRDSNVLYFSVHRYEHGKFWPNLRESNFDFIGEGTGKGYNINVPLNKIGMGNTEYLTIWHEVLIPLTYEFKPDLILISAGYDAAMNDPKGQMMLTPQCYPHLVSPLMKFGKVVVVLEGGYCLDALSEGAALTLRTLLDGPCPRIPRTLKADDEVRDVISKLKCILQPYWNLESLINTCQIEPNQPEIVTRFDPPNMGNDLQKFPTRNPNPVESFENNSPHDELLHQLKISTQLPTCAYRIGIYTNTLNINGINENGLITYICQSKEELIEKVLASEIASGLILDCSKEVHLKSNIRPFLIEIGEKTSKSFDCIYEQSKQITFAVNEDSFEKLPKKWALKLFASHLAPIAYKFNPDIIIVTLNFSPSNIKRIIFWIQLCHSVLSPLAEGKLVFQLQTQDELWQNSKFLIEIMEQFCGIHRIVYDLNENRMDIDKLIVPFNQIVEELIVIQNNLCL